MNNEDEKERDPILKMQSSSTRYAYTRYVRLYEEFRGDQAHSEKILYRFLLGLGETMAATTLWTAFSLLKKYLLLECSFDIGISARITEYLKTLARLHKKKRRLPFREMNCFDPCVKQRAEGKT